MDHLIFAELLHSYGRLTDEELARFQRFADFITAWDRRHQEGETP